MDLNRPILRLCVTTATCGWYINLPLHHAVWPDGSWQLMSPANMPLRVIRTAAHMNVDDWAAQYAPRVVALWT